MKTQHYTPHTGTRKACGLFVIGLILYLSANMLLVGTCHSAIRQLPTTKLPHHCLLCRYGLKHKIRHLDMPFKDIGVLVSFHQAYWTSASHGKVASPLPAVQVWAETHEQTSRHAIQGHWNAGIVSPGLAASGQDWRSQSPLDAPAGQLLRIRGDARVRPPPIEPYTAAAAAAVASEQCTAVSAAWPQQQHPASVEKKTPGAEQTAAAVAMRDRQHTGLPKQHHAAVLTQTPDRQQAATAAPLLRRQDTALVHKQPSRQATASVHQQPSRQDTASVHNQPSRQDTASVHNQPSRQDTASVCDQPSRQDTASVCDQPSRQDTASVHDQPSRQQSMTVCGGACRSTMQDSQPRQGPLGLSNGGVKASPLQLMLCQWGLPRKVGQVTNPAPTPTASKQCHVRADWLSMHSVTLFTLSVCEWRA